jgi:hypothetical protein
MGNCKSTVIERTDVVKIIQDVTKIPKTLSPIIDSYLIPESVYNASIMKYTSEDDLIVTYKQLRSMMLKIESGILLCHIAPWIYGFGNNKEKRKIALMLEHMGMNFKFEQRNILILYNLVRSDPVEYRRVGEHGEYYSYIDYLAPLPKGRYIPGFYEYVSTQN